jgi:hypothetical protein
MITMVSNGKKQKKTKQKSLFLWSDLKFDTFCGSLDFVLTHS